VTPLEHGVCLEGHVTELKLESMNLGGLENLEGIIKPCKIFKH
jgi:hypothetical protein